jgi:hypothetical protein
MPGYGIGGNGRTGTGKYHQEKGKVNNPSRHFSIRL